MQKFQPLETWSPCELVEFYSNSFSPAQELINKQFPQVREALFRLGKNLDMRACWEKLLSKESLIFQQEEIGRWLMPQIYLLLIDVFSKSDDCKTPQFKQKEVEKIIGLVNKLINATHNSSEALSESFRTVQTAISEEIIKKYPNRSKAVGFDVAPISAWSFISGIRDVLDLGAKDKSLEPFEWDAWEHDKKILWILSKVGDMNLTTLLRVYLNQLKEIPSIYKEEYISSKRSTVTKKLFKLMHQSYGDAMSDCVTPMVNAILDLELGIEDITPYDEDNKKTVQT